MKNNLFWFRRDLRLNDNAGLYHALKSDFPVIPIFIFDTHILDNLARKDARVEFIHNVLTDLDTQLQTLGASLQVYYGKPLEVWSDILKEYKISEVYTNHDFEPYAISRDTAVKDMLVTNDIGFRTYKDHVIFEKDEITKADGLPYSVFTPYKNKWLAKVEESRNKNGFSYYFKSYPTGKYNDNFAKGKTRMSISLEKMGFEKTSIKIPSTDVAQGIIKKYEAQRNFPAIDGTSRLGIHFRFGTVSIREKARKAQDLSSVYLSELIWRDFYATILYHNPKVVTESYRTKYDRIEWLNNEKDFEAWKNGMTGYPLVDAGIRELNATGYMHNRVRMLVASFLTKHLLIDWRWGEAYFAEKLLDFDLASNNGGWQWASGSGTDAAPYFRIFSPMAQLEKFDKQRKYVRTYIPELGTDKYPQPIVDHKMARERCLATYKKALIT
ncbi:MAG: deoxyribodipyrimidine photo-lyase [Saprospiraceae bacterium]|nr:deoxyribodipyrimidine photo-lyase [Saprospiraceae bacterium]